jgi:hypothetical protein
MADEHEAAGSSPAREPRPPAIIHRICENQAPAPAAEPMLGEQLFEALAEAFCLHRAEEREERDKALIAIQRELSESRIEIAELPDRLDTLTQLLAVVATRPAPPTVTFGMRWALQWRRCATVANS